MGRDTVSFDANVPVEVSLAYPEGKIVQGKFGDRVMYGLKFPENHAMFLDLGVSQKINMLEVKPGEHFFVCKRPKNGSVPAHWDVWLSPAAERARADREDRRMPHSSPAEGYSYKRSTPPPAAPPDTSMLERQLAASLVLRGVDPRPPARETAMPPIATGTNGPQGLPRTAAPPNPPSGSAPAWQGVLVAKADALIDAYAACLEHANKHGNQVKPEDVRAMLTTVYIAMTKNGASSNAA